MGSDGSNIDKLISVYSQSAVCLSAGAAKYLSQTEKKCFQFLFIEETGVVLVAVYLRQCFGVFLCLGLDFNHFKQRNIHPEQKKVLF